MKKDNHKIIEKFGLKKYLAPGAKNLEIDKANAEYVLANVEKVVVKFGYPEEKKLLSKYRRVKKKTRNWRFRLGKSVLTYLMLQPINHIATESAFVVVKVLSGRERETQLKNAELEKRPVLRFGILNAATEAIKGKA